MKRRANARNVRPYYPYWQYSDLFIVRFVFLLCLRNTLRLLLFIWINFRPVSCKQDLKNPRFFRFPIIWGFHDRWEHSRSNVTHVAYLTRIILQEQFLFGKCISDGRRRSGIPTMSYDKCEQEIHSSGMIWVLFEFSVLAITKP